MRPIQYLLVLFVVPGLVLFIRAIGSRLLDRALVLILGAIGLTLVIMPQWSTRIANAVGVDRGVDLVTYLGLVGIAHLLLLLWARHRELESRLTMLVRSMAIATAQNPLDAPAGPHGHVA